MGALVRDISPDVRGSPEALEETARAEGFTLRAAL
jgi:hypothetical protein